MSTYRTKVPYLPAYRLHFFKEKKVQNLGCGLYAGTRVLSSLICKISRHTQSQQSYWKPDSLIECIVWGQVNPCLRRILLLSAAMSVSSFRISLLLDEVQRSLHVKPRSPFDAVHVKPHLFLCRTTRRIPWTRHKKKSHKWNWYKISVSKFYKHCHVFSDK